VQNPHDEVPHPACEPTSSIHSHPFEPTRSNRRVVAKHPMLLMSTSSKIAYNSTLHPTTWPLGVLTAREGSTTMGCLPLLPSKSTTVVLPSPTTTETLTRPSDSESATTV
jgi:hypothetical protein